MKIDILNRVYNNIKEQRLFGRYITNSHIEIPLKKLPEHWVECIGYSVEQRPIYKITLGQGPKKVLLWSQMHGNESTTTKALFDCFNFFLGQSTEAKHILDTCTLCVIPILNPDGAEHYSRFNANAIDLNRDAQNLSQPESRLLRTVFESFNPDFCFNLHGQRTIFGAGQSGQVATLSFLSPSKDMERSVNHPRKVAMALISRINMFMQDIIPGAVGRYDDGFNLNCVGDTFQSLGAPTLLYEAGHYRGDYQREDVRHFVWLALVFGLSEIGKNFSLTGYKDYFTIPENLKNFRDLVIKNARLNHKDDISTHLVFQYKEVLRGQSVHFNPYLEAITTSDDFFYHREIDANHNVVLSSDFKALKVGYENDFVLINNEKTALNP
jgi:hypothetical protein